MKTLYAIRKMAHVSDVYGIQVSCADTHLLRVHVRGSLLHHKRKLRVSWEWVATGRRIEGKELEQLMQRFPVCEFLDDDAWQYRFQRKISKRHG